MNEENTANLISKYPILYRGVDKPLTESLMAFGFEVGDGWFDLLDRLSAKIEAYNHEHPEEPIEALQVKEKFGGLRFYTTFYVPEVEDFITEAEEEADDTCEKCGARPAEARGGGWIVTLCDECASE